jgi:hypothetical protein
LLIFHGEGLSTAHQTIKLEEHPVIFVNAYLFNVFAATLKWCRLSLHPQPKDDALVVVTRDPRNIVSFLRTQFNFTSLIHQEKVFHQYL